MKWNALYSLCIVMPLGAVVLLACCVLVLPDMARAQEEAKGSPGAMSLLLMDQAAPPVNDPTALDFQGDWSGTAAFQSASDSHSGPITVQMQATGPMSVAGSWSYHGRTETFSGEVREGVIRFPLPCDEPQDPDCRNWDVTCTLSLADAATLKLYAPGTYCGGGGGQPGLFFGTLTK